MATEHLVDALRRRPLVSSRRISRRIFEVMVDRFARNNLLTYASAMTAQLLTAAIPLALLAFLLVGAFGKEGYWRSEVAPKVAERVSAPVYAAVDSVVEGLIDTLHPTWLVLAVLIVLWEVSGSVRTVMGALDTIFERDERRSIWRRFGLSFLLAAAVAAGTLGAALVVLRGGRWVSLGAAQPVWTVARWLVVVVLLGAVVAVLLRFAPNGRQPPGWVTLGSVLIVAAWIGASLVFGWWVGSVADYESAFGTAVALLTLVGYLYTSSIVFLVGAQLDRLVQEQVDGDEGPLDGAV